VNVLDVDANVVAVRERIDAAARRAGRGSGEITLVAAVKTVALDLVVAALRAGVTDLGENRAQELTTKAPALAALGLEPRWHFIGALQRNKVRTLAEWVALWHSVDRTSLVDELGRRAPGAAVLVEVNVGGEPTKAGCPPGAVGGVVDAARERGLAVEGLMTVPPAGGDPRRWFAALADLAARHHLRHLSMGMTDDYEIAVEEGATIVRVGRALFGPRPV
jgi:pyridoxal phosphate enzyme (YggS family)